MSDPRTYSGRFSRRALLAGTSAAGLASVLLRPLLVQAEDGPPKRLLILHRPCGTRPERFFPDGGSVTDFELPAISSAFEAIKGDMTLVNEVTCPRDPAWIGDKHGTSIITMMSGRRPVGIPGTDFTLETETKNIVAVDKTIDQFLLANAPALQGAPRSSLQLGAYRPSGQNAGAPCLRVLSYSGRGAANALYPECRPDYAYSNVFGDLVTDLGPESVLRARAQNKSVLDLVAKDIGRLAARVPASQRPKLDQHLDAIRQVDAQLASFPKTCRGPALAALPGPSGEVSADEAAHVETIRQSFSVIKAALLCDVTRVATFSFAHGNSELRFQHILPGFTNNAGHHDISHETDPDAQAMIDRFYCEQVAELVLDLKNTPDGAGKSLLDNTLVVFFSEVSIGVDHNIQNMPLTFFGGSALGHVGGRHLRVGHRYMNDVWTATANAFGVPIENFGDAAFSTGPIGNLFV
jgi:Protein of unknown function (DUF1552)